MKNEVFDWQRGLPRDVLDALDKAGVASPDFAVVSRWLFGEGRLHTPVKRYLAYLKLMSESFQAAAEMFDLWSTPGSTGKKESLRLTNPEEILYIANHLYVLESFGVPGVVLECGCAHGFSSACLSLACGYLGRRLVIADSFEGLPATRSDEPFFRAGDYAAREEEVLEHVRVLGRPDAISTVKGWYSESLCGWNSPVAILWMDVDLHESARDLLVHVFDCICPQGAIFTHEYTDFYGKLYPPDSLTVPGAIHARFSAANRPVRDALLTRYWGIFGGPEAVQFESHRVLDSLLPELNQRDPRARRHAELRDSRTVRLAFAVKRLLSRRPR